MVVHKIRKCIFCIFSKDKCFLFCTFRLCIDLCEVNKGGPFLLHVGVLVITVCVQHVMNNELHPHVV